MPIFKIKNKKILFIHIPKCYGTSIDYCLNDLSDDKIILDNSNTQIDKLWGQTKKFQLQHLTATEIFDVFDHKINEFDFVFTFIRNPIDRFFSECSWYFCRNDNYNYNITYDDNIEILDNFGSENKFYGHFKFISEYLDKYRENIKIYTNLDILSKDLEKLLNIKIKFEHINKSLSKNKFRNDQELLKKINEKFKNDIELYNQIIKKNN